MTMQADFHVGTANRRTDIDLLRVVLCGVVILMHALLIFSDEPRYHLKSALPSAVASLLYEFLHFTAMPSFFVLAGWSAVASLRMPNASSHGISIFSATAISSTRLHCPAGKSLLARVCSINSGVRTSLPSCSAMR